MSKRNDILYFTFLFQYPIKKLMRTAFGNYDDTGRIISTLFKHNFIEDKEIEQIKTIELSALGKEEILSQYPLAADFDIFIRKKNKGKKNKLRQIKIASIVQILNRYVPEYMNEYYDLSIRKINGTLYGGKTRAEKFSSILAEMQKRKKENTEGRFFISVRELRDIDETRLKNLPSVRASGIFQCETGTYITYNHLKKRMRVYGGFEKTFSETVSELFPGETVNSIHFGMSYKALYDSIIGAAQGETDGYILPSMLYGKQYYVPLTYDGAQQIQIYTIPDFHQKICNAIIFRENQKRANSTIYDGITEDGDIDYLGFECDFNSISTLYQNLNSIRSSSDVYIFCFPYQASFYAKLFGDRAHIHTVTIEQLLRSIT